MTPFRHKCDANGCWLERRWDSHSLGQAAFEADGRWPFPRRSSPTDIDGGMDSHGREQLLIETKEAGAPMAAAQRVFLEGFSRRGVAVLVQECAPPSADAVTRIQWCIDGKWSDWEPCDRLARDRQVQRWFEWAESTPGREAA